MGIIPRTLKNGGTRPTVPPLWRSHCRWFRKTTKLLRPVARIEVTMLIIKPRYPLCWSGTLLGDHVNVFKHSRNSVILASAWNTYIFTWWSGAQGHFSASVSDRGTTDWKFSSLVLLKSGKGSLRPGMGSKMPGMGPVRPGNNPLRTGMGLLRHVMGPFRPGRDPLKPGLIPLRPTKGPLIFGKASLL